PPFAKGGNSISPTLKKGDAGEFYDNQYEKWKSSHQPFHWFAEFYEIVHEKGGFDVIIGNPPYVEYSKVKNKYTIKGYKTESCGNLYAYVMEGSVNLVRDKGRFGMISPISLPSTPRMTPARDVLIKNSVFSWCSNFADRPGTLFTGVHQKLSIVLSKKHLLENNQHLLFTTSYKHWYSKENKDERKPLMETLCYVPAIKTSLCWLKTGNSIERSIYDKLTSQRHSISKSLNGTSSAFSLAMRMMYWGKSFTEPQQSNEYKNFKAPSSLDKKILVSIFNSTLYFWFWELISDGWHITAKELDNFFLDLNNMAPALKNSISNLTNMLIEDLDSKKGYVGTKQTDYEYYHKLSKPIIDEIDRVLAKHYGFTEEELDFIITYDIKYRMGRGSEGED
ncbi:MAG: Eco57I restriction-modification methylase domain-containing protein, partial [Nitrospinota bacterium]